MCGPEPKLIHSMTVSLGPLAGYKLHAHMFGGRNDGNLGMHHENCALIKKWIYHMALMLNKYTGKGRFATIYSAYMGNIMAQVGWEIWGVNMAGTVQSNQCGAGTAEMTKKMKPGMYGFVMWQHNDKPLLFAAWGDISVVKTLSNCHRPEVFVVGGGVSWKRRGNDWKRERMLTEVYC